METFNLIRRAEKLYGKIYRELEPRLTDVQFRILRAVDANPGKNQTELVKITGTDRSTLGTLLDRLQLFGHITLTRNEDDERASVIAITTMGHTAIKAADRLTRTAERIWLSPLSPDEQATLEDLLKKMLPDNVIS